jgi:hypothetical protein
MVGQALQTPERALETVRQGWGTAVEEGGFSGVNCLLQQLDLNNIPKANPMFDLKLLEHRETVQPTN